MAHNLAVLEEPNETEQRRHNNEVLRTLIGMLNGFFPTEGSYSVMELAIAASQVSFDSAGNLSSNNVQDAMEELDDEKQETLVSGTNIKTINSESILGSGNISIATGISEAPIDGNTYGRKDGAWEQVSVSGGGANITIDTYANRPASPSDGDIFLPTNSLYAQVYDTSSWKSWGPIWKMTPFISGDFSWTNQGSATITTTAGVAQLVAPKSAGTSAKILTKSKTGTFTVTTAIKCESYSIASINFGILLRESSSGKFVTLAVRSSTGEVHTAKWNNATTYVTDYSKSQAYFFTGLNCGGLMWLRITDNGTNRICYISFNGIHWINFFSVARDDFCDPDEVGVYVDVNCAAHPAIISVLSWEES